MIIISADYFGPELKGTEIWDVISQAMRVMKNARAREYQGKLGVVPHANVVFMVSGSQGKPNFDGVRLGPYSSRDKCVQIDVAVSAAQVESDDARSIVLRGLHMANAAAFHFFGDKGMDFPLREAEELVAATGEVLGRPCPGE